MTYEILENKDFNSLEISFSEKPDETIRNILKSLKFRWHAVKKVWYGYTDRETLENALNKKEAATSGAKEKQFDFDVKVGDLFCSSWGYDQTNIDFFQVIALVGKKSVRVRAVNPPIAEREAVGGMSEDISYINTTEILPPSEHTVFINDNEKGDLKRLKSYAADGKSNPFFDISSFASAHKYNGEKLYKSWYA